jgi:hypothetical protein
MIDLGHRCEPYDFALPYGLSVTVKPLTTAGMAAAQAAARRTLEAIERLASERRTTSRMEASATASYQAQLIRELAVRHITDLDGGPAPAQAREHQRGDGALYPVGERFFQEFTLRQVLLNAAKNGCMDASRSASAFLDRPA